ncbi:MAG TPA: fumarate hydratase [Clostridiales bacterium]|nr:fumarate hydratase [Clostridiales bacterium]
MSTVYLTTPLKKEDIEKLELDDVVYISGDLYTMMYADHFTRIMDMIDAGEKLPMELEGGVIYNTGTIFRRNDDGTYDFRAIGTTTSSKFNPYTADFIRKTGVRAVLGKGGMDKTTLDAMQECGCVYLALVGGCAAIYTEKVDRLEREYWPHKSWADNMLKINVTNYGPMFVSMDAHGNSIYEQIGNQAELNRRDIYKKLNIGD